MREAGKQLWIALILPLLLGWSGLCLCPHPAAAAVPGAEVHAGHCADAADPGVSSPGVPGDPAQGCSHCGELHSLSAGAPAQVVAAPAPLLVLAALLPWSRVVERTPARTIAPTGSVGAPRSVPSLLLKTRALRI